MATKIRLQRQGRKRAAIFHIVAADSRAPRDGKYIERLGVYNPNTHPATVTLNFDAAVNWVGTGAEMTDTARSILSKEGVLLKNHLNGGVAKGALTQEQADAKFEAWLKDNGSKLEASAKQVADAKAKALKEAFEAETKVKEARAAAQAAAASELAAEAEAAVAAEQATEEVVEEVAVEEATEEVVTEAAPEAEAEEKTEE